MLKFIISNYLCSWGYLHQFYLYGVYIVRMSSQLHVIHWGPIGSPKLAMVKVFTPWELTDATAPGFLPQRADC